MAKKYEYKVVKEKVVGVGDSYGDFAKKLNKHGNKGWKIIDFRALRASGYSQEYIILMMKEK